MKKNKVIDCVILHFRWDEFTAIKPEKDEVTFTLPFSENNLMAVHKLFQLEFNCDEITSHLIPPDLDDKYTLFYWIDIEGFKLNFELIIG